MARLQPGDELRLVTAGEEPERVTVALVRSRGWAELFEVANVDTPPPHERAIIAVQPNGRWWWIGDLDDPLDVDENSGEIEPLDGGPLGGDGPEA